MRQSDISSPLLPCLLGVVLMASTPVEAQTTAGADGPVSEYPAEFFEPAQPYSAFDMIARLPGFTFYGGDQDVRGFSGASGNVLIDGERPTGKQETLEAILRRIPARSVVRIELIRPGAPGVDMQGAALLANVVRTSEAVTRGRAEASTQVSSGGRLAPMLSLQMSRRSEDQLLEVSAKSGREINDRKGEGPKLHLDRAGVLQRSAIFRELEDPDRIEGAVGYEQSLAGGKLRVDASARRLLTRAAISETVTFPAPALQRVAEREELHEYELGARGQRTLASGWRADVLAMRHETYKRAEDTAETGDKSTLVKEASDASETIVRGLLQKDGAATTLVFGAEAAINRLESHNALFENRVAILLPAADVTVEERRAEAFATVTWRPSPKLTLEAGARYERSKLTQGEDAPDRSLGYLKPRGLVIWAPDASNELRLEVERRVGQLDFDLFVGTASLTANTVTAGNPDIQPDRTWRAALAWERRLGQAGSIVVTLRHEAIEGVVDRVPVRGGEEVFDAPGNIGKGTRDEVSVAATLPLEAVGVSGGQVKADLLWRRSKVIDPATGMSRAITGEPDFAGAINFTQDLPSLRARWGIDLALAETTPRFMFNEVRHDHVEARLGAFAEYRPTPAWNVRLRADNLNGGRVERRREQYDGLRPLAALRRIETRSTGFGSYFGVTVERALGG
jgi:hypothetical protein